MKLKLIIACWFAMMAGFVNAQSDSTLIVHKDARIESLLKKQSDINRVAAFKTSSGQYKGYRIMVLNTNDRDLAYQTKSQMLSRFPEHAVYIGYQAPFFKLKMGDFLKREDADDLKKQLSSLMPKGVFIVPDIIKLKPEDELRLMKDAEEKGN